MGRSDYAIGVCLVGIVRSNSSAVTSYETASGAIVTYCKMLALFDSAAWSFLVMEVNNEAGGQKFCRFVQRDEPAARSARHPLHVGSLYYTGRAR